MEPPHISEERRGDDGPGPADNAPRGGGKVHRIGQETRGLFEDFTAWVELRLRLVQLDVQGYIRQKIDEATLKIALVAAGLFSGLFALVTLALFAGWLFGHPAWGFLAVTGLLLAWTGLLYARHRRTVAEGAERMQGSIFSADASKNGSHASSAASRSASSSASNAKSNAASGSASGEKSKVDSGSASNAKSRVKPGSAPKVAFNAKSKAAPGSAPNAKSSAESKAASNTETGLESRKKSSE